MTANWKNRTIWTRDNLQVLRGLNCASVDLIYLDPPFNSNRTYSAPIGSIAAGAAFKDAWTFDDADRVYLALLQERDPTTFAIIEAARQAHGKGMAAYLGMMAQRLVEMQRVLKPSGSIYLHCNQFASHYLRMVMDSIFGRGNFVTEIVWNYGTPSGGRSSGKKPVKTHDTILVYAAHYGQHIYRPQFTPYSEKYIRDWFRHEDQDGRAYRTRSRHGNVIRQYLDESKGMPLSTVWSDIMQLSSRRGWFPSTKHEETGYPTQKPLALLDRIIKASSNAGDVVLDPFCGCATACVSAERLEREWLGIDVSVKAAELVKTRLDEVLDEMPLYQGHVIHRTDQPHRDDLGDLPPYQTHKDLLYGQQDGFCGGCGVNFRKRNLTVDHIVPQAHGGTDHIDNLWLLCGACNSSKGTRSQEQFLTERMKHRVALFPWLVG